MVNTKITSEEMENQASPPQQKLVNPNFAFADSTMVATSRYDIKVFFGTTIPTQPSGETQFHTIISLSPQLAKALAGSLQKAVDDYDKTYMSLKMRDEK